MSTVNEWLCPGRRTLIGDNRYDCVSRVGFHRRGGGMVLLRPRGVCDEDLIGHTVSADLEALAGLEAEGLVSRAQVRNGHPRIGCVPS